MAHGQPGSPLAEEVKKGTRYWLAEGALLKKRQCVGEVWEREG